MENILKLKTVKPFVEIIDKDDGLSIANVNEGFVQNLIALDFINGDKTIFLVLPNISLAQKYYDELSLILGEDKVLFYPADEFLTSLLALSSLTFKTERIYTIKSLLTNTKQLVILNQAALMYKTLSKKSWLDSIIKLEINKRLNLTNFVEKLISVGYKREYTVLNTGEFSIKGSIIDIFPIGYEKPFRIDLFDVVVESIKMFEPSTQLSLKKVERFEIMPMEEFFYADIEKETAINKLENHLTTFSYTDTEKKILNQKIDELYQKIKIEEKREFLPFFTDKDYCLFDFTGNKKIYFYETDKMLINEKRMIEDLVNYNFNDFNKVINGVSFYFKLKDLLKYKNHQISLLNSGGLSDTYNVFSRDAVNYGGSDYLYVNELESTNETNVISITNDYRYLKLIESLDNKKIKYYLNPKTIKKGAVNLFYPNYFASFTLFEDSYNFISERDIYDFTGYRKQIKYRSVLSEGIIIENVNELQVGDYVVHYDYGIGKYEGIKTMELSGIKRDYLHIRYYGTDYLYVPVDQVSLILKYSSSEGYVPTLNKIGTKQWEKTKKRVKKELTDISDKLLGLYKERLTIKGFSHKPNTSMHKEFDSNFEYIETPDQQKAIDDVFTDMEKEKPMDRLICGDVGYGKTEVALRASFKAVYSDKQVAYLVPTTVLARQHYYVFKKRFEEFGVNVELLSRFVTTNKQKEIIERLKMGKVDIIIGTHRILSEDVVYKDLGLLIIDEEQRFGVKAKEKIKELKVSVDALSLSATPIPRTLQMSLVGIKDLSMIETAPLNRYPIQTHVIRRHDTIIKDAILKEYARGGQTFYLYNRVEDMELIVAWLQRLVPEVKIGYAHGKMSKLKLERTIADFIDKKFDCLVSTTIIETGIDIPNANTLIVHDADKLGLSQLYQIRGRVGRSDKIAYAYLLYGKNKILTPEAEKRLKAIKDFQALGSGFKVAMRDLTIRGAGDLLGDKQSGFIESVGLEMYLKLLDEIVDEKKGIKREKTVDDDVILSKRRISKSYIQNDEVRLEIHQRIAKANNLIDIKNLIIELIDRFGEVDKELEEYMYEKLFYKLSNQIGAIKINKTSTDITLILSEETSLKVDGETLFKTIFDTGYQINLKYIQKNIHITLIFTNTKENYLYQMINYLSLVLKS